MTATMCCRQMSGMSRLSTTPPTDGARRTVTALTSSASNGRFFRMFSMASSGAWMGVPTVHFLMSVLTISYRSPSLSTSADGLPFGAFTWKKLSSPENTSSTPFQPERTSSAAVTPLRAGMPANTNPFSMWSVSRSQIA